MQKIRRSKIIEWHPGFIAAQQDNRQQYEWLKQVVAPARVLSVTQLCRCPRRRWHERRAKSKPEKPDASARFRMMRGTLYHAGVDAFTDHPGSERLLWTRLDRWTVLAGTPDLIVPEVDCTTIFDLKTTRLIPDEARHHDILQINLYAFLLLANGHVGPIEGLIAYASSSDSLTGWRFSAGLRNGKRDVTMMLRQERSTEEPRCDFYPDPGCTFCNAAKQQEKEQRDLGPDPFGLDKPEIMQEVPF